MLARSRLTAPLAAVTLLLAVAVPAPASAQAGQIFVLTQLVELMGAAAEGIGKLADSFEHIALMGVRAYDGVAARRERDRLVQLSARTTGLASEQRVLVFDTIPDYLADPDPATWDRVTAKLNRIFPLVRTLLEDVRQERSDFVLEPAYKTLDQALSGRAALLDRLTAMPPPLAPEELALLRQAQEKYVVLIGSLERANAALSDYLRKTDP